MTAPVAGGGAGQRGGAGWPTMETAPGGDHHRRTVEEMA